MRILLVTNSIDFILGRIVIRSRKTFVLKTQVISSLNIHRVYTHTRYFLGDFSRKTCLFVRSAFTELWVFFLFFSPFFLSFFFFFSLFLRNRRFQRNRGIPKILARYYRGRKFCEFLRLRFAEGRKPRPRFISQTRFKSERIKITD